MTNQLELADVVRRFGKEYIARHGKRMMPSQRKALQDIAACQTREMGGRRYQCDNCSKDFWHYHGCRNRSCPKCHGAQTRQWLARREAEVLPCGYFHAVVTVPEELRPIFLKNQKIMYGLLFQVAANAIRQLCLDPKYVGAEPAILGVLHTWTNQILYHPHVHFLVSAGGITEDGKSWREARKNYLIPAPLLSKKVAIELRMRLEKEHPDLFRQVPRGVWHKSWCSFIKAYGQEKDAVVRYLSRYVFRIAVTNARVIAIDATHVTFRYKDRDSGEIRQCRIEGIEFLRRYLMHVLPRGFHKVRYYGLWHHSRRGQASRAWLLLMLAKPYSDDGKVTLAKLAESLSQPTAEDSLTEGDSLSEAESRTPCCPHCGSDSTVLVEEVSRHGRR